MAQKCVYIALEETENEKHIYLWISAQQKFSTLSIIDEGP